MHVSFVRSLTLDTLTVREQRAMALGGNAAFAAFLADPARAVSHRVWLALPLETRYFTPAADLYRRRLQMALDQQESGAAVDASVAVQADGLPANLDTAIRPPPPPAGALRSELKRWTANRDASCCELCRAEFHLLNWRHHCRKCGRCVCDRCSPAESWRPLPELGTAEAQRHCKLCVTPTRLMPGMGSLAP